jgi:hypothetical protein
MDVKMNNRERFRMVMEGDAAVDRYPVIEWANWWDKTIAFWENESLPPGLNKDELYDYFNLDCNTQFWFATKTSDCPVDISHGCGIMENAVDYQRIKRFLYPQDAVKRMMGRIEQTLPLYHSGQSIVWYTIEGFFWFPRVLFGIENHFYSFYDYPELYHQICNDLLEWQIAVVDEFAKHMKADFMTIAEDMSYNHGSMISQGLFDEFIKPYYKRLIPEIKKHGTKVFIDSDGNILKSLPWFVDSGIDGILPLEHQAGVDLTKIRTDYPEFLMIGGFDKMAMLKGKCEIRAEFERILPIIRSGRYIPSMDHQTPPGTTMENYKYYVKLLEEYGAFACKDKFEW